MYDKKRNKDFAQNGIEVPKRKGVRLNYDEEGNVGWEHVTDLTLPNPGSNYSFSHRFFSFLESTNISI